jgi:integrase
LIQSGASVKAVQARLGHASAKVTLDVYGHLWPDEEDRTRSAIDEILGEGDVAESVTETAAD